MEHALALENPLVRRIASVRRWPAGGYLVDLAVAAFAPFNAAAFVHVESLAPGEARTSMRDRFFRRNHLGSIHAMALATLGEITGNMAILSALPEGSTMIVTSYSIEFVKKARGTVRAACDVDPRALPAEGEVVLETDIVDATDAVVARVKSVCRIRGPKRAEPAGDHAGAGAH